MYVYRMENHRGHGPIHGCKREYPEPYDYRGTFMERYYDEHPELNKDELVGTEMIQVSYDTRKHIRTHKTPQENHPYFTQYGNIGTFFGGKTGQQHYFGFRHKRQLLQYIRPHARARRTARREGFFLATYEVARRDCIIFPDGQIAFKKHRAKRIRIEHYTLLYPHHRHAPQTK